MAMQNDTDIKPFFMNRKEESNLINRIYMSNTSKEN